MGAVTDLFKSERGLLCLLIIIGGTVLAALDRMTVDQWTTFIQWIFGTYVVGKTATGVAAMISAKPAAPADPATNNTTNVVVESQS